MLDYGLRKGRNM